VRKLFVKNKKWRLSKEQEAFLLGKLVRSEKRLDNIVDALVSRGLFDKRCNRLTRMGNIVRAGLASEGVKSAVWGM